MKKLITIALAALALASCKSEVDIDLAGKWRVSLDSLATFSKISIPGTLDDAGLGEASTLEPALQLPQLQSLNRKHSYIGAAFYRRNFRVSAAKAGKPLLLSFERVLWQSSVWIDGEKLEGDQESLTTPHRYYLPEGLSAGKHEILVRIDNRKRYDISRRELAHAYTNDTQIKWNGMLGTVGFDVLDPVTVSSVDVFTHPDTRTAEIKIKLLRTDPEVSSVKLKVSSDCGRKESFKIPISGDTQETVVQYAFNADAALWDEFSPAMHTLEVKCGKSVRNVDFGIREIKADGNRFKLNGRTIFLRGTLDCCIFPLTGTPPTDEAGWEKVISTCKAWGLNHIRFHSYCPPDAAFRVADRMGFYLQVELPIWSSATVYENVQKFLMSETDRILENYGNHPSFCFLSGGNELDAGYDYLNNWLKYAKEKDSRHLYTNATYSMGAGHKGHAEPEDQYFIGSRTYLGQIRGQDYINNRVPDFRSDYSATAIDFGIPMVSHEIGQYSVYPNISEIDKYTGVLEPLNFISVKEDLEKKGLLDKAADYTMASGKLAAILYKEEVERALKTPGLSGFQLLGLQDFPGQCTALVGLVDSFWDSKGLVSEEWFRQACSPVTPLARYSKAVWMDDETFSAGVEIANYSASDIDGTVEWSLGNEKKTIASGSCPAKIPTGGNTALTDSIKVNLSAVDSPEKLTLKVSVKDSGWSNSWDIWVYPAIVTYSRLNILSTSSVDEAVEGLRRGATVLFSPDPKELKGETGKFVPVFWSPVFFPYEAGTMGVLCNPSHPALAGFPTEFHSNWQWWNLTKHSAALDLSAHPDLESIVDAIDNFVRNRRLSYIFEAKCLNGRLLFSTMDLLSDEAQLRPETRQMYASLLKYMNSKNFDPKGTLKEEEVKAFMK